MNTYNEYHYVFSSGWKRIENVLMFSSLNIIYYKNPSNFKANSNLVRRASRLPFPWSERGGNTRGPGNEVGPTAFPGTIHLILSFWLIRKIVPFESSTNLCFSISYDLTNSKSTVILPPLTKCISESQLVYQ